MGEIHPCLGEQFRQSERHFRDIVHPVIYIIDLPASSEFPAYRLPHGLLVIFHYICLNGHTVHRRFLQNTHIPDPDQTHMKSPGNRSRCEREDVHILFQLLDLFLVGDAEALFLVNDQKPQILIFHIFGQYPVRADHHIHLSFFQIFNGLFLLGRGAEPAQQVHSHGKFLHPLDKGVIDLLGQYGGRHQIHHLPALLYLLKGGAERHLRLAVSHVAAHKAVHDLGALHIPLGIFYGGELVLCLLIGEHFLEFLLPYRIRAADIAFFFLAHGVKLHQFPGDIAHRSLYSCLCFFPFLPAQLIQLRRSVRVRPRVFLQGVQLSGEDIEIAAAPVLDLDIVLDDFIHFHLFDPPVDSQSVPFMYHEIADGKLRKILDAISLICFLFLPGFLLFAENIRFRDHRELDQRVFESFSGVSVDCHDLSRLQDPVCILPVKRAESFFLEIFCQTFRAGSGSGHKHCLISAFFILLQILHQKLEAALIGIHGFYGEIKVSRKIPSCFFRLKSGKRNTVSPVQFFLKIVPSAHPAPGNVRRPFFFSVPAALAEFLLHSQGVLHQTVGFIQEYQGFIRRKIIRERNSAVFRLLFRGRIDHDLFQILQRTLALGVETADGVNLIPPQFDTPGILLCEGIDIHDPSPDGELPRHLHLTYALIAHLHQTVFQFIHIQRAVVAEIDKLFFYIFQRSQKIHTAIDAGHHGDFLPGEKSFDHLHSLADDQISMDIRLKKQKVSCRIKQHISVIKAVILIDLFGAALIFREDQMTWKKPGKPVH